MRDLLLIDMDAFFASVEQARHPQLRGRPVVVGGRAESRGVVSTASYEARACGVRTAMPMAQAQRLCPQAAFLPVDMTAYRAAHRQLLELFGRFTDLIEPVSIDEAFLDVTGSRRLFGTPQRIAADIQRITQAELGLTCSIGIGPTRLLAKLAAGLEKPGGLTTLGMADVRGRLRALPVGVLSGVGPAARERLRALGIATIGELQDAPLPLLEASFGSAAAAGLRERAYGGRDDVVRHGSAAPRSVSREVTFAEDIDAPEPLEATLLDLADRAAADLRRGGHACRTVTVKLRDAAFHTRTRQCTLPVATTATAVIYDAALALLRDSQQSGDRLRLLGVTLSGLSEEAEQLALDEPWRERACDDAVDRVRARYGARVLHRAGAELAPYRERPRPGERPR
ncbi:MAG: DNA polymerase IV, partial [Actinobacteria bacterium]|nr:DNA polymerase IV [Actinomycetota bacterium]